LQEWGDQVRDWYWSVWTKPNSQWDNPGMTFEKYRAIYEDVAQTIAHFLGRRLHGRNLRIGGPSVDGFQPFWVDWVWRFVDEIEPELIGFVCWHRYGEWRLPGEWRSAANPASFSSRVLSRTSECHNMARALRRMLGEREILNVCSELNAHAHPDVSHAF